MPTAEDHEPRPAEDPFDSLVLDEEFVQGATVKEASGRARTLTAKWKRQPPPEPEQWRPVTEIRRSRFGRRARRLDAWGNPVRRKGPRNWQAPLFVVLAVAVVLAGLNIDRLRGWYHGDGSSSSSAGSAPAPVASVAPETAKPSSAPPTTAPQDPTVAHPWTGSPAEGWPTGAEAFVLPQAQAIGVFSEKQVAAQLQLVKEYLSAADLDPAVLSGGRPDAALAMLDPKIRDRIDAALGKPSKDEDPTTWITRFDPKEAILVGDAVKVQGRITVDGDGDKGVLVHTDFTFVYALRPGPEAGKHAPAPNPSAGGGQTAPGASGTAKPVGWVTPVDDVPGTTGTTRTIVRRVQDFRFYDPARYQVSAKRLFISDAQSDVGNSACDVWDGFLHPEFEQFTFAQPAPGASASGPATDPYDRSKDLSENEGCGTVTRT